MLAVVSCWPAGDITQDPCAGHNSSDTKLCYYFLLERTILLLEVGSSFCYGIAMSEAVAAWGVLGSNEVATNVNGSDEPAAFDAPNENDEDRSLENEKDG